MTGFQDVSIPRQIGCMFLVAHGALEPSLRDRRIGFVA